MSQTIRLDLDGFSALAEALARLSAAKADQLLDSIGMTAEETSKRHIEERTSPDGKPFKPWSERYRRRVARRGRAQGILFDRQELHDSISHAVDGSSGELLWGAKKKYAPVHQFGSPDKNIPARPYLGVGRLEEEGIAETLEAFMREVGIA